MMLMGSHDTRTAVLILEDEVASFVMKFTFLAITERFRYEREAGPTVCARPVGFASAVKQKG
jgi:hypothetical protein